jgi:hypothetical protein
MKFTGAMLHLSVGHAAGSIINGTIWSPYAADLIARGESAW